MFILTQVLIPVALLLVAVAPLTANSEEVNSSTTEYGFLKDFTESNRIVGGHEATRGQFPHQVSVRDRRFGTKYSHRCGGSIITNRFVLTAAHCFQRRLPQPERYRIVAGAHQNNDNDGIVYNVRRWILHEGFLANFTQPNPQVRNDIALIETTTTIRFNRLIRLITLHTGFIGSGTTAVVSGWGSTNDNVRNLKFVHMNTLTNEECRRRFLVENGQPAPVHNWETICSFSGMGGHGICGGDSGGPLMHTQTRTLIGIASWTRRGISCGLGYPDGFMRISTYVDWINHHIHS